MGGALCFGETRQFAGESFAQTAQGQLDRDCQITQEYRFEQGVT